MSRVCLSIMHAIDSRRAGRRLTAEGRGLYIGLGMAIGALSRQRWDKIMTPAELASRINDKLHEARDLTVQLGAEVLEFFIEMAILEARDVEKVIASNPGPKP